MGDRCYLNITMSDSDIRRFGPFVGWGEGECWWDDDIAAPAEGVSTVGVMEANWGWLEPLKDAARAGLVFIGGHDAGCNYGAFAFVGVDGEYHEVPVAYNGDFAVGLDDRLRLDRERVGSIYRFLRTRARADGILGLDRKSDPESVPERAESLDDFLAARYLLRVAGAVEPVLEGPYPDANMRAEAAGLFAKECGRSDCLFRLDVDPRGVPSVLPFNETELAAGGS